ncbi:MAG TPA: acetate uptake transporter [Acidimicrobiia bacterium]|nr:acetate uptake transporter [Acidimicrobiia bacterium]
MDRANPAPLGLMGFGMTTVLLNLHNAGFFEVGAMIIAMGFFYGGMAQVFAGIMEFRKANTFGTTAFTSYGLFWISLGMIWVLETSGFIAEDTNYLAWYLFMWGIFTAYMYIGTLKLNRALQVVFGSLTILFVLLAIGRWADSEVITKIAGWEGIVCGFSAIYAAAAQVLNEVYGRQVLPLGPVKPAEVAAAPN